MSVNDPEQFDRLPETEADRSVTGRATRRLVLDWWEDRFGVSPATFEGFSFWEKGAGKLWICRDDLDASVRIEALGLRFMHTRQEHWKPTTNAVQRFGHDATRNVLHLGPDEAAFFVGGGEQAIEWNGDWGYLIVMHDVAGMPRPVGVGLYTHGTLKSQISKGRRRELDG